MFDSSDKNEKYYTQQEVAELLGISTVTVYHYAKKGKIRKVEDPYRNHRKTRYYPEEVDALTEIKKKKKRDGTTPAALAKKLGVTKQKIYQLINELDIEVHEIPYGNEQKRYVIPHDSANQIKGKLEETAPTRGLRTEFYHSRFDIALYQLFTSSDGHLQTRVIKNEKGEWGFFLTSTKWIPIEKAEHFGYKRTYSIHQPMERVNGYTDLLLPKENGLSYLFLDFIYQFRGIENIRVRENEDYIALSVKAGSMKIHTSAPQNFSSETIRSFLKGGAGEIVLEEDHWTFISGYHKTSIDLPVSLFKAVNDYASKEKKTFNEVMVNLATQFLKEDGAAKKADS
ncbi:helix-turn-helix domain-containing protein [Psychrobacillus sp. MER TA 171]|uniref:helix-turn-helix domain-containing protein n=1 Tax=Psychrobacillus sp. MER TA 171 TaxID=2939577 RepID=UPI00203AAC84|nr:helix-turn-helix domain-containing protein [Psychrobacillus sp. MER TA 171]MCM3358076.1 helix-turn-helix domain-containing protein [Psychrobacillus sp. MER TA 171]